MEITQFTYFQQAGGLELSPIAAELTYGLERIAMVLQKVTNVYDLEWAPGVKYGDVRHRDEVEQSRYAFGQVGIGGEAFAAFNRDLFDKHYAMAQGLIGDGLRPAGARALPEVLAPVQHPRCQRWHRGHRADGVHPARPPAGRGDCPGVCRRRCRRAGRQRLGPPGRGFDHRMDRELLLEIGCEELPASWLPALTEQLAQRLGQRLKDFRLTTDGPVESSATPRRLTAHVTRVAERQSDLEENVSGPAVVGGLRARRHADTGGRRFRAQVRRRGHRTDPRDDAEGRVPLRRQA